MAKPSETFRKVRKPKHNSSESFRSVPKNSAIQAEFSERPPDYTLSVLEVLELFKKRGVGVTERTIINWCHPNDQGIARLTARKDPAEGKWYITPQSVEYAILEEQKKLKIKAQRAFSEKTQTSSESHDFFPNDSEAFGNEPNRFRNTPHAVEAADRGAQKEDAAYRDLLIANRFKDLYIKKLETDNQNLLQQVIDVRVENKTLQTRLLILEAPTENKTDSEPQVDAIEQPVEPAETNPNIYEEHTPQNSRTDS